MVKYKKEKERAKLKPKEKLMKYLIENKGSVSIRHASGAISVDYKNTYNAVIDLQASGAITQKSIGNIRPIEINLFLNKDLYGAEQIRTEEFLLKNPKLKLIRKDIEEVGYPFMIVVVFGSYVKNTKTEDSDIDICIISDNKEKTKKLTQSLNLLSLKFEIHEFTTDEFVSMVKQTQNNLGHEIIKSNVILYGTENYYNLISKWMKKE